ncbi:MAG: FAD-dependent oxidoreductase, partial [Ginsengibacter sp.]
PIPNYWAVIDFLLKACLQCKATIKTNEPVVEINTTRNVEVVTTLAKYNCRKILIAVPLGILQRSKNSAGYINFPSSVVKHIKAAKKIGSGGVIKFLFEFDEAFWLNKKFLDKKNIPAPSYIFTDTKIPTWWTQYPADYPLLTGWVAGPDSHKMKNYSPRKLKKIGLEALSSVFSMPPEALNDRLKTATIINWIKEPYIFGGYSYPTLQTEMARNIISEPVGNSFYFAGEYVIKDSSSTVDAALQSGQEAAKKILRAYSGKSL